MLLRKNIRPGSTAVNSRDKQQANKDIDKTRIHDCSSDHSSRDEPFFFAFAFFSVNPFVLSSEQPLAGFPSCDGWPHPKCRFKKNMCKLNGSLPLHKLNYSRQSRWKSIRVNIYKNSQVLPLWTMSSSLMHAQSSSTDSPTAPRYKEAAGHKAPA